ncbi:hypothetical protein OAM67_01720 [bacterium]|nr:hypothetical protein [bacterium]
MSFTGTEVILIVAAVVIGTAGSVIMTVLAIHGKVQFSAQSKNLDKQIFVSPIAATRGKPWEFYKFATNIFALFHAVKNTHLGTRVMMWDVTMKGQTEPESTTLYFPQCPFTIKLRVGEGSRARDCMFRIVALRIGGEVKGYYLSFVDDACFPPATRNAAKEYLVELVDLICSSEDICADLNILNAVNVAHADTTKNRSRVVSVVTSICDDGLDTNFT